MKILVADDSQTNLAIITDALLHMGHEVTATRSGEEALAAFLRAKPDLVILDVLMDGMDGFECAAKIRAIEHDDWIPIIFLSGSVDDNSIAKGIDAGGDDYLTKPFSQVTLSAKVKAMQRISDMRKKLYDTTCELSLLSSTDALTSVYNRLQFNTSIEEKLAYALRHNVIMALLFIDLDNFKFINDHFGHHAGDLLLKEVAQKLKSCVRKYDFVARLGGDEFAIIIQEVKTIEHAGVIAQNVLNSLLKEYQFTGQNFKISGSIGIACYPFAGTDSETLIRHADMAMYHAKQLGRNNYQYFTDQLFELENKQNHLRNTLRHALDRQEFFIVYEPIFNLESRELIGLEALVRWKQPQYGVILPKQFYPLAEEVGINTALDEWILKTICEQASEWYNLENNEHFKVSFTISSSHLLHKLFPEWVQQMLDKAKMPATMLEVIINTQKAITANYNQILEENIKKLSKNGIGIALDDFGLGFSPLFNIQNWPVTCIKINKSFVADITTHPHVAKIVRSISHLANDMGLAVIAKGIHTEDQVNQLLKNGCNCGQGRYFGEALEANKISAFLYTNKE
ncbi:MAG: EAL domain-containing protein [Legionellales bacterium]|nr:EAL domain-containing protein [Legionellales bacterium]